LLAALLTLAVPLRLITLQVLCSRLATLPLGAKV
jgi:hypothetical protein